MKQNLNYRLDISLSFLISSDPSKDPMPDFVQDLTDYIQDRLSLDFGLDSVFTDGEVGLSTRSSKYDKH